LSKISERQILVQTDEVRQSRRQEKTMSNCGKLDDRQLNDIPL